MIKILTAGLIILMSSSLFAMSLFELNTASKIQLMQISGIGEAKANTIFKERKKGKFTSFTDFQRVDGIGEVLARNVKNNTMGKSAGKRQDANAHAKNAYKKSIKQHQKELTKYTKKKK